MPTWQNEIDLDVDIAFVYLKTILSSPLLDIPSIYTSVIGLARWKIDSALL